MQASGGTAPRARCGSMTMATRSGPAAGDLSLAEIKEFAGFAAATQRYIRRSLDIGLERDDAIARWSRDRVEETAIRVQAKVYRRLADIRAQITDDSGLAALEGFLEHGRAHLRTPTTHCAHVCRFSPAKKKTIYTRILNY